VEYPEKEEAAGEQKEEAEGEQKEGKEDGRRFEEAEDHEAAAIGCV
jgi:hypothetical protein